MLDIIFLVSYLYILFVLWPIKAVGVDHPALLGTVGSECPSVEACLRVFSGSLIQMGH